MKKLLLLTIAICYLTAGCYSQTDWKSFMSRQDMTWTRLPQTWYEAPFMGNGSMGSYICKEPGKNAIRVDVGNSMVHDHRTDDASIYGRGRLLIGYFLLHPVGEIKSGDLRLDLWNAETTGCIRTTRGEIKLRACVTSESPYILVEAEATAGEKEFTWKFYPENTDSPRQLNAIRKGNKNHLKKDYVSNPAPQLSARNGLNLCWQPLLAGGGTATAWKEIRKENTSTLIVSNAHSFPGTEALQKAETALASLQEADLPVLRKAHREWWHNYYSQSFVSLPDKKMENFYWAQMYKLASATRTGGGLLDNSGPWQVLTPWPNAWWNLNVQLSYWSVYPSNRLELGMPLVDAIGNNLDNLINNVPEPYRKDAAALPVATDFTLTGATVNVPGTEKKAQVGNLTWICHNLWLQYRFSMDESILRNTLYPTLRRAVNFYLPFLTEDKSGKLHLKRTYSPEYGTAEDCNYDIALLRWGCNTLLEASRILSVDDELIPRWKQVAEHLTDYPQDENGMMIGKVICREGEAYIPFSVFDNPNIAFRQVYEAALNKIRDQATKERLLYGNWDFVEANDMAIYNSFDGSRHLVTGLKEKAYDPTKPLITVWDFNVAPQMSVLSAQIDYENRKVYILEEILGKPEEKENNTPALARKVRLKLYRDKHIGGVDVTGDPSGLQRSTTNEDGINNYTIITDTFGRGILRPKVKLLRKQPPQATRCEFVNEVFGGYEGWEIQIDIKCRKLTQDLIYQLRNEDGTKSKQKTTDPKTGVKYERYGHLSDCLDYLLCYYLRDSWYKFKSGGDGNGYVVSTSVIQEGFSY